MIYQKLFYRLYLWALKIHPDDQPAFTALYTVTSIQIVNLLSVVILYSKLTGKRNVAVSTILNNIEYSLLISVLLLGFNYLNMVYKIKDIAYLKEKAFSNNYSIAYIIISFFLLFTSFFLKK